MGVPHFKTVIREDGTWQRAYSLWISNEKCLLIISLKRKGGQWAKIKTIELPRHKPKRKPLFSQEEKNSIPSLSNRCRG